jgi:DeoR family fructose operon transcriptional repressor
VLFISCDGLSFQRGLTTPYRDESVLKRAMLESARRVVAMVDQSKFGNDQMFAYAALDEIDVLVTDARADDDALTVLAEHDLEVRRA